MPRGPEVVEAEIVDHDEEDVGSLLHEPVRRASKNGKSKDEESPQAEGRVLHGFR